MKDAKAILKIIQDEMADIEDSHYLNESIGWFCDQFNEIIIANNEFDKEKPKTAIFLNDGESLKSYKNKVYKSSYRYQHGIILEKDNEKYIYFNPELSQKIDFEKPNKLLLELGYHFVEYISLVTEELKPITEQSLSVRLDNIHPLGDRITNFLGVVWHAKQSNKKFPKIQIKISWVIQTRVVLNEEFSHAINKGMTPNIGLSDSIDRENAFEENSFYIKLAHYKLPKRNELKQINGVNIGLLNENENHIKIYLRGDPIKNKITIDEIDGILSEYAKRGLNK